MKTIKNTIHNTIDTLKAKFDKAQMRARTAIVTADAKARLALSEDKGEFVVQHGGVMLAVVALLAVALVLMKQLMNDTIAPAVSNKMMEFFN